jgi:hypothetical protein
LRSPSDKDGPDLHGMGAGIGPCPGMFGPGPRSKSQGKREESWSPVESMNLEANISKGNYHVLGAETQLLISGVRATGTLRLIITWIFTLVPFMN